MLREKAENGPLVSKSAERVTENGPQVSKKNCDDGDNLARTWAKRAAKVTEFGPPLFR